MDIYELIAHFEERLVQTLGAGTTLRQHYQPYVAQSRFKIDHVHFHILPRTLHDAIWEHGDRHEHELFVPLSPEEHGEIAALLR